MGNDSWSVPESAVLSGVRELLEKDTDGVLTTIVDVEGSAYRRPGAKMIIPRDGDEVGSITAGCLEGEVSQLADDVLREGRPRFETFDLMNDDDDIWGLGVGCNGIIDLLLEPIDETYEPVVDAYESEMPIASFTVLESTEPDVDTWQRAYYRPEDGPTTASNPLPSWLRETLIGPAERLLDEGKSDTIEVSGPEGRTVVFVDGITPPPTLVSIGTGHDVNPVVELATKNGFRTVVVGFRGANATAERFPQADTVVSTSPADVRNAVDFDEDTYVVVMSHNFVDDRLAIDELVETPVPYVGLLGPRNRFEEMLEEFHDEGRHFTDEELDVIYTPIGIDIGGGTPYQIAHSIVAEVLAVHNDRDPKHLKDREGPIHDRIDTGPLA